uniref:Lipocalin n=1 Tax=Medicago truncatula TaxID=3880 RepID=A7UQT3_MEDTR|nr:Lipocalin [Medicago truncatula]
MQVLSLPRHGTERLVVEFRKEGGREVSGWWRMMCKVREGVGSGVGNWFDDNIRRVVGNGSSTFFWTDKETKIIKFALKSTIFLLLKN